jgi:hypothetical protein
MKNPELSTVVLSTPWKHAVSDNVVHNDVFGPLCDQLERTEFLEKYKFGNTAGGSKINFQYHMDGARNRLEADPGSYDLSEIVDVTQLMAMWDGIRDHIYSLHHRLEPEGTTPFKSIMIEYARLIPTSTPTSRPNTNRMDNYIMLDLAEGVIKSVENGFTLYKDQTTSDFTVKWAQNRMLSFCPKNNRTWFTYPDVTNSTTRYFNIALR